ncbi:MAG: hypothetical protein HN646_00315 [Nitrospina sp.]|nr:hypothetical protein [Nitrospina sp.]
MKIDWRKGFTNFLLETKLVNSNDMEKALSIQSTTRPTLGQLALEKNWVALKDIFKILKFQKNPEYKNKRFGEIAQTFQMLDRTQVDELIMAQNYPATFIGEILVSEKSINKSELILALKEFNCLIKESS